MSDDSYDSTHVSASRNSSLRNFDPNSTQNVAIFDWDDTLFCTKYIETLQLNLQDIFSFKLSFEDNYSYLVSEFKELEEVSDLNLFKPLIFSRISSKFSTSFSKKASKYLSFQMRISTGSKVVCCTFSQN